MTTNITQITACVSELAAHVGNLAAHCRNGDSNGFTGGKAPQPAVVGKSPPEVEQIKRSISMSIAKLQTMLMGPAELLQHLAYQNQLLACLQWLGQFQILAYIPLNNSVSLEDIAELSSVPKSHLSRIVRMTAAAGFLQEPQLGHVAHTELSAHFVMRPSYHDAAMFLSETAAPAALHMVKAMQLFGQSTSPSDSAYNVWQGTAVPFVMMCEQLPHLRRQWPAYLQHVMAEREGCGVDILKSLGCFDRLDSSSAASVVEVGAETTERVSTLAKQYPNINFIVQMIRAGAVDSSRPGNFNSRRQGSESTQKESQADGRINVYYRAIGTPQPVRDAAIYILDLSSVGLGRSVEQVSAELRAHMDILRANSNSSLAMMSYLAPGRGTVRPEEEAMARLRDLCLFQLSNQQLIDNSELSELVNNIHDAMGRLSVVQKVCSPTGDAAAIEVRYQPFSPA